MARGREIFDSLNARWRRFKALEDSPESSRVVGSRSGPSSESPYSYSLETGHTENPMRQRYAVRDYHSPLGTAGFMGNPSGDIPWGGGPPAGEPSAAFRLKINTLNQRMVRVYYLVRSHHLTVTADGLAQKVQKPVCFTMVFFVTLYCVSRRAWLDASTSYFTIFRGRGKSGVARQVLFRLDPRLQVRSVGC